MIEVEAKVKVSESELNKIKFKIARLAKYKGIEKKIDDYYTLLALNNYPKKSLRVRSRSGFYEVNFKKSLSYKKNVHAKKEIEFKLKDIKNFLVLIKDFGFKHWLRKDKTTYLYEINPKFHIELNYLKRLGWFIEVELLVKNKKEIQKARSKVYNVLKKIGFSEKNIVKDGYTKLLWDKR